MLPHRFMFRHIPRTLPIALALVLASGMGLPAKARLLTNGRQVVTAQDIRDSGLTRLSDILLLADDWSAATLDGVTWWASPGGLEPFEGQDYTVLVDGIPVDLQLFDTQSLNRLPLALSDIDSVEFISESTLHEGIFTDRGLIEIHTRRPAPGISVGARLSGGAVVGHPDGGPIGPEGDVTTSRRGDSDTWASLAVTGLQQAVKEPRMAARLATVTSDDPPAQALTGASFRAGWNAFGGQHRFIAGRSRIKPSYFFLVPYGREIPVESTLDVVALSGRVPTPWATATYRLALTMNSLTHAANLLDLDPDYHRQDFRGSLELSRELWGYNVVAGFTQHGGYETSPAHKTTGDDVFGDSHLYGSVSRSLNSTLHHEAFGDFDMRINMRGVKAGYRLERSTETDRETLTFAYAERLFDADPASWVSYYFDGYEFASDVVRYIGADSYPVESIRHYTTDLELSRKLSEHVDVALSGFYRFVPASTLPTYSYGLDSTDHELISAREGYIYVRQSGNLFGARAAVALDFGPALHQEFSYRWINRQDGDSVFVQSWRTVPEHRANWRMTWSPMPGLRFSSLLRYQSGGHWSNYDLATAQSDRRYDACMKDVVELDLTAARSFLDGRFRFAVTGRNLLNHPLVWHPAGALVYGRAVVVQMGMQLDELGQ